MTTVIDERVVEMRFNNADFEKNVAQSMSTLEKLKGALNFDSAKSLENIGKVSKQFSMENVGNQVETVQTKFSAMQIAGITAISELTKAAMHLGATLVSKVLNPITSGGMRRAENIESAKFMLEGLHVSWEEIKDDINYGVKDTAYGLDQAAKAASQLVASNVKVGDSMKTALRGISGVAAMTNRSYDDIADIFTDVAGKGRLMASELNRLSERGLNAAAVLAKAFGTTEAGVREMAKKGQIDFEMFAKAMDDAFGEHAKDANKTFNGALSNVKAALSRIGAEFATPYMENMRKVFVSLIDVINGVNKAMKPIYDDVSGVMDLMSQATRRFLESEGLQKSIPIFVNAASQAFKGLFIIITTVREAFRSVFPYDAGALILKIANAVGTFVDKVMNLVLTKDILADIYGFFKGISSVIKAVITIFKTLFQVIVPVEKPLEFILKTVFDIFGIIGYILTAVSNFITQNATVVNFLQAASTVFANVLEILSKVALVLGGAAFYAIKTFVTWIQKALMAVRPLIETIGPKVSETGNKIANTFSRVTRLFSGFNKQTKATTENAKTMGSALGSASKEIGTIGTEIDSSTNKVKQSEGVLNRVLQMLNGIKNVFVTVVSVIAVGIYTIGKVIFTFFTDFGARFRDFTSSATGIFDYIKGFFKTIGSMIPQIGQKVSDFFAQFGIDTSSIGNAIKSVIDKITAFVKKVGTGRIAAIAFAAAMLVVIINIARLSEQFIGLIMNLKGIVYNIKNLFNFNRTSNVTAISKSILMIAGALTVLAIVNEQYDLKETTNQLLKVMAAFAALVIVLKAMDLLIPRLNFTKKEYTRINEIIFAFALSIGVITAALVVLNRVQLNGDWLQKLALMGAMLAEFGIAVAIISKISPALSKGSILLLSLALSMKLIVDALAQLGEKDIDGINKNMKGFALLFVGVAAMTAAAGRIRITSALSLIVVAKALQLMFPVLKDLIGEISPYISEIADKFEKVSFDLDKLKEGVASLFDKANSFFDYVAKRFGETQAIVVSVASMLTAAAMFTTLVGGIVGIGIAIGTIISAIGALGNVLKGAAVAIIGVAVAIKIATGSIIELSEYFRTISDTDVTTCLSAIGIISLILVGVVGLLVLIDSVTTIWASTGLVQQKRTSFFGIAAAIIGVGAAMLLIVKAMEALQGIDQNKLAPLTIAMASLLVALGIAAAGAGMIKKGVPVIVGMVGVCLAIALLLAEVAILSTMWTPENQPALIAAFAAIEIFLINIAVIVGLATKLKGGAPALGIVFTIATMLGLVMGSLIAVGHYNLSLATVIATLGGLTLIIAAITVLISKLTKPELIAHIETIKTKLMALIAVTASMMFLASALKNLASVTTGWHMIWNAVGALSVGMGVVLLLVKAINKIKVEPGILSKIFTLAAVIGAVWVLAQAIKVLAGMKDIPWTRIWSSLGALMVGMVVLTAIAAVFVGMSKTMDSVKSIVGMGVLFAGLIGMIWTITNSLSTLADIDTERLKKAALTLGAIAGVMTIISVALGVIQSLLVLVGSAFGSAVGGWAGALALPALLLSIGGSVISMGYGLELGAKAIEVLSKALNNYLIPALKALSEIDIESLVKNLSDLAGPLAVCGLAFGAFGIGGGVAAAGIILLAFALSKLTPYLGTFADGMRDLETINIGSIASDLLVLAVAAAALGGSAGGVGSFAVAIGGLASALLAYQNAGGLGGGGSTTRTRNGSTKGGSFGSLFGDLKQEATDTTQFVQEQSETVTKTIQETNDGLQQEVSSGVLYATDAVKEGTGEIVTIVDEDVAKAGDIVKTGVNNIGTEAATDVTNACKDVANAGKEGGEEIAEYTINAYGQKIKKADTRGPIKKKIDEAKNTLKEGANSITSDVGSWFQNGGLSEFFSSMGLDLGKLSGGQWKAGFLSEISGILGMQGAIFKQIGWNNYAGKEISQFGAGGMPTEVMAKQYGTLKGNIIDAAKQNGLFNGILTDTGNILTDMIPSFDGAAAGAEGLAEAEGKAGKGAKDLAKDLKSTLEGQLDMFSKFEIKTGVSAQTMIDNMKSNIDGFASWSHRMAVLAQRFADAGIDKGLYQKLAEMGPKGYETMNAFYQMSEEQLAEVKDLWATGLTLPESQANIVASGYQYMGEMAAQGFSNALDDHMAAHEAAHGLGKAALDGLSEVLEVHSPSKATERIGDFMVQGLALGILSDASTWKLTFAVVRLSDMIMELFNENLAPEKMQAIGENLVQDIFTNMLGVNNPEDFENPMITAFITSLENLDAFDEAIRLFVAHLTLLLLELFEMASIESPSMLFQKFVFAWFGGITEALQNEDELQKLHENLTEFMSVVWSYIEEYDLPRSFYDMGVSCTEGMAEGMMSDEALAKVAEAALMVCMKATEAVMSPKGLDINSPSKKMRKIFESVPEGAALGILDGAETVYNAALTVAQGGANGVEDGLGRIQDVMDIGNDFSITITPILDVSYLQSQLNSLNSLMNVNAGLQNGGISTSQPETQQINFTQNNYSPKALSRIDIYRQTKNQISMLKGVTAHA